MKVVTVILITIISIGLFFSPNKISASYKFPWPKGYYWEMTQGWHCGDYSGSTCLYNRAIDIGSSENRYVISSEEGTVVHICTGTYTKNIRIRHSVDSNFEFEYLHIDKDTLENNITVNSTIKQGQVIGMVKADNFSDDCGSAVQSGGFGHTHWAFEDSSGNWGKGRTIESWTLCDRTATTCDGATTTFTSGSTTKSVGDTYPSTNTMLITGSTFTGSRTYFAKTEINVTTSNGDVNFTPSSGNEIVIRAD